MHSRWVFFIQSRTLGIAAICETAALTSALRISLSGYCPFTRNCTWPSVHCKLVFHFRHTAPTAFAFCTSTFCFRQCHPRVLYIAPVSTCTKPSARATSFEFVLFPLALVPSI